MAKTIVTWVITIALAALYAFASYPKLLGRPDAVEGFRALGYTDGFRLFIGACELSGAIGLLIQRLATWAALGLLVIMAGAVYTHVSSGIGSPLNALICFVLLAILGFLRRDRALFLSSGATQLRPGVR